MNVKLLVVASLSLLGCTGARVVSGGQPVENATVTYFWCSSGVLHAAQDRTNSSGDAIINPFSQTTNGFDMDDYVPPGTVAVTVQSSFANRQRIITHAFNQKCQIPWNNKMTEQDCSKDGFSLTALTDTFNVQENAPVYKMPTAFDATICESPGHPLSANLVFPAEWPASCRSQDAVVSLLRGLLGVKLSICN
ncbi:MAG: hypothetical protein QM817_20850 [Archangium sp.]